MAGHDAPQSSAELLPPIVHTFIRQEYSKTDPALPEMLEVLTAVGAAECWHKKSTFKAHLLEVYKILKIWGTDDSLARCGLMHSAYSNSFVNLAIFKPDVERSRVAQLIGQEAEALTYRFCVVPRQQLIQVDLLDKLPMGSPDLTVPAGGLTVPHIRTGEPLHVDLLELGQFLVLTMADFAEQLFSWQDCMFGNTDGALRLEGAPDPEPRYLWPGPMLPGLWVSAVSRMGRLLVSCKQQLEAAGDPRAAQLTIPPVFDHCSCILTEQDQQAARDLYWEVVSDMQQQHPQHAQQAAEKLQRVITLNPWVPEPHLMLAQLHIHAKEWGAACEAAGTALKLFAQWGTAWDKRMPWDAWVAWTRVCYEAAVEQHWPQQPLGVLSMGMVQGL
ncbi:hypothetical protein OEZ86_003416 [Tetradesmus obliquus]|nr:hypothetical protein OEZ86_003416 [Tetradesmus obliquus]